MKNRETPQQAALRVLLGGAVSPELSADQIREYVERHDEAARRGDDEECDRWRQMLIDRRRAGETWDVVDEEGDLMGEVDQGAVLAVLQDLRDELRGIRQALTKRGA